jgi:hypothetical protein
MSFVDIHAVLPDVANGLLHVDGVPVDDGIESETQGTKLLFLTLLKRAADLPAFAMVKCSEECGLSWRSCRFRKEHEPGWWAYP